MKRLFIGVPISSEIKEKVKPFYEELELLHANVKLVGENNLHFTLKFLGDVAEEKIFSVCNILKICLEGKKPFSVTVKGIAVFPCEEQINTIWVSSADSSLRSLMKIINEELDFIRKEKHEDTPHITIARVKSGKNKEIIKKLIEKYKDTEFGTMLVNKVILYESELRREGPVYKVVKIFLLN